MSGITIDGRRYTRGRDEALDSLDSMVFVKHWLAHVSDKSLGVWAGFPMHKGQVRTYLTDGERRSFMWSGSRPPPLT